MLKFLSYTYNFILFFQQLHFPHNVFALRFRIFIVTLNFEEYLVLVIFPFLSLFLFFPFLFFPHFPFPFLLLFLFFFPFPNLHHFLNLVCHFLRAPLPCSRTFCCPGYTNRMSVYCIRPSILMAPLLYQCGTFDS